MDKKKGFTLIEIVMCLVLLCGIILISIVVFKGNNDDKKEEESVEKLTSVVEVLTDDLVGKNVLEMYNDAENIRNSYFCLTKQTILDYGIIDDNNEILNNMSTNEYVRVEKDELGKYILKTDATIDECKYLNGTISDVDTDPMTDGDIASDGYVFTHKVLESDRDKTNEFIYSIDFDLVTGDLIERKMNVYTVMIVDGSSSMGTSGFNSARNAAKSLSSSLIASNSSNITNYVSAISFSGTCTRGVYDSNAISKQTAFLTRSLVDTDFKFAQDCTHYYEALEAAYNKINGVSENSSEDYMYFVIFLTDGINTGINYDVPLNNLKTFLNDGVNEVGKLIVVGFDYSGKKDILVNISSDGCIGSDTKCFYDTTSSDVMSTFQEFFKLIQNEVNCYYDKVTIDIELEDNFYSYEENNKFISKELNFSCEGNTFDEGIKKYISKIFNGNEYIYFKKNVTEEDTPGVKEFPIIKEVNVSLFKRDDVTNEYIKVGDSIPISGENFSSVKLNIAPVEVIN